MHKEEAEALYDESYAALYDGLWGGGEIWAAEAALHVEWLSKCMDPRTRWLDAGCGTGWILSQFPDVDRAGIDLSPAMLGQARAANPGVDFRQGDLRTDVPEWFNTWDLVSSTGQPWSYVESIGEVERIAENLARWTAPTGTLFIQPPDIADLTGTTIPYNFSGEKPATGSLAVTGTIWSYYDEGGAHENMIFPSLDVWVRWLSQWFHRVEVHTWPRQPEFLPVNRRIILAKGKRQADELSPTEVVLYPHPDEPEGTPPNSFPSGVAPNPVSRSERSRQINAKKLPSLGLVGRTASSRSRRAWGPFHAQVRARLRPLKSVKRRLGALKRRAARVARARSAPSSGSDNARPAPAATTRPTSTSSARANSTTTTLNTSPEARALERLTIPVGPFTFDAVADGPVDGEPVLLLHGYPESSYQWRFVQPQLAAAGVRSVAPDLRGYSPGARPTAVEDYRADALISDVIGFADHLGWDRFHLVGHDWGGGLAWHVAGRHPERLSTLTVLSTPHPLALAHAERAGLQPDGQDQAELTAYMTELAQPGHERSILADGGVIMRTSLEQSGMPPETAAHYMRENVDPDALAGRLRWYGGFDFTDAADHAPIVVPTLYLWSTLDPVLGRLAAERTADHVAGPYRFEVLEGVGHWISEEVPDVVVRLLLEHLGV